MNSIISGIISLIGKGESNILGRGPNRNHPNCTVLHN